VWYVTLDGRQHNLGPDKDAAFEKYKRLLSEPKAREVPSDSLAAVIDCFLEWVQRHRSPDTYEWYRYRLQRFLTKHPKMRASDVRPFHVQEWVNGYQLSISSRRNYMRTVKRCLSWATKQGYLARNPVESLEIPNGERREVSMTPEDIEQLLVTILDPAFSDLVTVTLSTGCRPQESLRVEARHIDLENQRWVFPKSESKNKRTSRVVYLTDEAAAITARLVKAYPTGKLFRNSDGVPWTTAAVNCGFLRVRLRIGKRIMKERGVAVSDAEIKAFIPKLKPTRLSKGKPVPKTQAELKEEAKRKLTFKIASTLAPRWSLYALRHVWATNALRRGLDPLSVALLMGHRNPAMVCNVYQHVAMDPAHMLAQAKKAGN
jgi:integrase